MGLRSGLYGENGASCSLNLWQFELNNHCIVILEYARSHQGRKKSIYRSQHCPHRLVQEAPGMMCESDHMTLFQWSRDQHVCSWANWSLFFQLASLISGLLKTVQLFSPNPLHVLHTVYPEMLLLSILNIAMSSTVNYYYQLINHLRFFSNQFLTQFLCLMQAGNLTLLKQSFLLQDHRICPLAWLFKKWEATHCIGYG